MFSISGRRFSGRELGGGASGSDGSDDGRHVIAGDDFPDVVSGDFIVRSFVVSEPVFLVPERASVNNGHLGTDRGGAAGPAHGGGSHAPAVSPRHALGVHAQPRAVQREGARAHHHLRQLRRRNRLRHPRHHRRQDLLQEEHVLLCLLDSRFDHPGK